MIEVTSLLLTRLTFWGRICTGQVSTFRMSEVFNCSYIIVTMVICLSFHILLLRFYGNIFNMSGALNLTKKYGDWFSWSGSPRSKIFARNHTMVTNITTMINLMRYVYKYVNTVPIQMLDLVILLSYVHGHTLSIHQYTCTWLLVCKIWKMILG